MGNVKEGSLVIVDWDDSTGSSRWVDKDEAYDASDREISCCQTVGWLLRTTPKSMTIYASADNNGNISDRMVIPSRCVKRVRCLPSPKDAMSKKAAKKNE